MKEVYHHNGLWVECFDLQARLRKQSRASDRPKGFLEVKPIIRPAWLVASRQHSCQCSWHLEGYGDKHVILPCFASELQYLHPLRTPPCSAVYLGKVMIVFQTNGFIVMVPVQRYYPTPDVAAICDRNPISSTQRILHRDDRRSHRFKEGKEKEFHLADKSPETFLCLKFHFRATRYLPSAPPTPLHQILLPSPISIYNNMKK